MKYILFHRIYFFIYLYESIETKLQLTYIYIYILQEYLIDVNSLSYLLNKDENVVMCNMCM